MITHSHILVLDNLKNRGAWQAKVYGVAESDTAEQLTLFPAIRFLLSSKRYLAILTRLSEVPIKQKEETPR